MAHRTIRKPTEDERAELRRMKREEVGRVAMRAHMMLLSDRGCSASRIAELHEVTHPTVYKWMDRFDEEGPEGLFDRAREGRPRKIDEDVEEQIEELLQTDPVEEGENATRWTTPRIAKYLDEELDVDVHPETVRDALQRLEYSWTRPRRQLCKGPDYEERLAMLAETVATADPDTTLLFADETEIKRFPPLRVQKFLHMWQPTGEQRAVWVPRANDDFALYGALDVCTGETYTEAFERELSEHTIGFLEALKTRTTGKVLLIWDQATWHTSQQVESFLAELDRFETFLLPKRAPEANPMEDLWRELKAQVAACLERSLDALRASCRRYFEALSPEEALRTAGIGYL